jgi:hypothetical protein
MLLVPSLAPRWSEGMIARAYRQSARTETEEAQTISALSETLHPIRFQDLQISVNVMSIHEHLTEHARKRSNLRPKRRFFMGDSHFRGPIAV